MRLSTPNSELFIRYKEEMLEEFESHRPGRDTYSPISFHTNFLPNTLVAMVMTALLEGSAQELSLNALFLSNRDEMGMNEQILLGCSCTMPMRAQIGLGSMVPPDYLRRGHWHQPCRPHFECI